MILKTIFIFHYYDTCPYYSMDNQKWTQYLLHWRVWFNCGGSPCHQAYEVKFSVHAKTSFQSTQNWIPHTVAPVASNLQYCRTTLLPFPLFTLCLSTWYFYFPWQVGASYIHSHFGIRHFSFSISLLASNTSKSSKVLGFKPCLNPCTTAQSSKPSVKKSRK